MDSVSVAFELMRLELETEIESLNADGAACFRESDYEQAKELIERGEALKKFSDKTQDLEEEWRRLFADIARQSENLVETAEKTRQILSGTKSSKTGLLVRFPDGETISKRKAAETLVAVIKKIGFDRVASLNILVNGENIVSRAPSKKYNETHMPPYYVKTHSSTQQKKKNLEQISENLALGLCIVVI